MTASGRFIAVFVVLYAATAASAKPPPEGSTLNAEPEIIVVEEHTRPIASLFIILPVGSLHDPLGKEGLAYTTATMLQRGAGDMTQAQIAEEVDFLGSTLSVSVGRETTTISGDALTRNFEAFEKLLALVLTQPTFPQEELDKVKRQNLAELTQIRDSDPALGQRFFIRKTFKDHPYARALKGLTKSIKSIGRADVVGFYKKRFRRQPGIVIGAAGDIDRARLDTLIERTLGQLPSGTRGVLQVPEAPKPSGIKVLIVDKPQRSQTQVFIGHPTLDANHADFLPLLVANTQFGGTFTATLSHEIREKRGWSYGAYSYLHTDRRLGTFLMRFHPSTKDTIAAIKLADQLFSDLVKKGITANEIERAKKYLANSHPFSIDTPGKRLHELLSAKLQGRADDFVETFVAKIKAVTPEQVNAAIARHFSPDAAAIVIVATASDLKPALEQWPRVEKVDVIDYKTE